MVTRNFKIRATQLTIIAFCIEVIILLFPILVIAPADYVIGLIRGYTPSDGWTYGVMIWFFSLFIIPIMYIVSLVFLYLNYRK